MTIGYIVVINQYVEISKSSQLALQICVLYRTLNFRLFFSHLNYTQIMMIFLTKVNEFIKKTDKNGTTKLSKKTPLILKRIFRQKIA